MKTAIYSIIAALLCAMLCDYVSAQAFVDDNDGLLDVGEAPGFPDDPVAILGDFFSAYRGIADLDGTRLLINVEGLSLSGNRITVIDSGDFNGLTNLQTLDLSGNRITELEQGAFRGLTSLRTLSLIFQFPDWLTSIEAGAFDGLTNLNTLKLEHNQIAGIDAGDFRGLPNVHVLDLTVNEISNIEPSGFAELTNLKELYLSVNQLPSLAPEAFAGLSSLEWLALERNDLTELNLAASTFESLSHLGIDESAIVSLVLNDSKLSQGSFETIVGETTSIVDASIVSLTFTDGNPEDLSALLDIATLDNVRVGPVLFDFYADEFNAFNAIEGNTVTVVPEPTAAILLALALTGIQLRRRRRNRSC